MIQANEIRIGNLINYSGSFTPTDFDEIEVSVINDIDKILRDNKDTIYAYDELYGILLTPEILERCGFIKMDERGIIHYKLPISKDNIAPNGDNVYELSGIRIAGSLEPIQISYTVNNYWAGIKIQFLHKLQNLYFSLTGEELNVQML